MHSHIHVQYFSMCITMIKSMGVCTLEEILSCFFTKNSNKNYVCHMKPLEKNLKKYLFVHFQTAGPVTKKWPTKKKRKKEKKNMELEPTTNVWTQAINFK